MSKVDKRLRVVREWELTISSTLKDIEIEIIYGTVYDNLWMPGEILDV